MMGDGPPLQVRFVIRAVAFETEQPPLPIIEGSPASEIGASQQQLCFSALGAAKSVRSESPKN